MSLYNGEIQNEWKKARVTPVYKNKGSKQDPNNFRPISVIGHIPKLFEKLVSIYNLTLSLHIPSQLS